MSKPILVHTVQDYAVAIGPHQGHRTRRADDILGRNLGQGCEDCGIEVQIPIADFKATGDLEAFTAALEPFQKSPEEKKKAQH